MFKISSIHIGQNSGKQIDTKKWLPLFGYCFYSLIAVVLTYSSVIAFAAHKCTFTPLVFCFVLLIGLAVYFGLLAYKHSTESEYLFLLVGVPAGLSFCLFILPGNVPDEYPHVWQVAALFSRSITGFSVPSALNEINAPHSFSDMYTLLSNKAEWGNTFFCGRYLGSYLPYVYFIASIPMTICRLLGGNEYIAFYLARLANLTVYLIWSVALIRYAKFGKRLLLVYLLNPMLIQQEASCSADAVINIVLISFVVIVFSLYKDEDGISCGSALMLLVLSILVCLSKSFAYSPLLLLLLLFVPKYVGAWSRRSVWLAVLVSGSIAVAFVILFYRGPFMQMGFELLRSPFNFAKVMAKTVWEMGPFWIESFAGYNLGALSINVWVPCLWIYLILIFLVSLDCKETQTVPFCTDDRILLWVITLSEIALICLSMREWTVTIDGRSDIFMGVQGRYFIPVFLLLFYSFLKSNKLAQRRLSQISISFAISFIYLVDIFCVIQFF